MAASIKMALWAEIVPTASAVVLSKRAADRKIAAAHCIRCFIVHHR